MEISKKSSYELDRLMDIVRNKRQHTEKRLKSLTEIIEPLIRQKLELESDLAEFTVAGLDIEEAQRDLFRRTSWQDKPMQELLDSDLDQMPTDQIDAFVLFRWNEPLSFICEPGLFEHRACSVQKIMENSCKYCHSICHMMHECPKLASKYCVHCKKSGHTIHKCWFRNS